jgi:uncharacterized cofD-like protein
MKPKPVVTVIGGGSGRFTLLEGLKEFPIDIRAIVAMTDSGGSSGRLKSELGVLPPGDVRQCLVALSTSPRLMLDLFNYRFEDGGLAGHSFGNLFLTAFEKTTGSFERAVEESARILAINGKVIPVTVDKAELFAELVDGSVIEGETNIDIPTSASRPKIRRIFLKPDARATKAAIESVEESDLIVIGPGDLYTSILPNFLVAGMPEALARSSAKKAFLLPLATKVGETDGFSAHMFLSEVKKYTGCDMDYVIANNAQFSPATKAGYMRYGAVPLETREKRIGECAVIARPLLSERDGLARHDSAKTAKTLLSLLEGEAGE